MEVDPKQRFKDCGTEKCFQAYRKDQTREEDKNSYLLELDTLAGLKKDDITFEYIDKANKIMCQKVKDFIIRYEWLGNIPNRPTHRFIARYNEIILGVVIMATPNAFSNILGVENKNLEKLIARGASMSLAPKYIGSALVMFSIRWMVENTSFRFFTCYSDPEAKELGTIYQACNFIYLGQKYGADKMYKDPSLPLKKPFSSREFRKVSYYKRYASELGVQWNALWATRGKMNWEMIPASIEQQLREKARNKHLECEVRDVPKKHKYLYVLGRDKRETKKLKRLFNENNPRLIHEVNGKNHLGLPYPTNEQRGVH